MNYTSEQLEDIKARISQVNNLLKDLQLDFTISFVDKKYAQNFENIQPETAENTDGEQTVSSTDNQN